MNKLSVHEIDSTYFSIFDNIGVSIWELDFSWCKSAIENLKSKGVIDFQRYFVEHPDLVIEATQSVKIIGVNEHSVKLFEAIEKSELMESLTRILVPDTFPVFVNLLVAIAAGQDSFESAAVVQTLQGNCVHVELTIRFPEATSSFDHVLVTLQDITNLKMAEANYKQLFDNAHDGIYVHDADGGCVIDVNKRAVELLGFTKDELVNKKLSDVVTGTPGNALDEAMSYLPTAANAGKHTFDWQVRHKEGHLCWVEVSLLPVTLAGEKRMLTVFHDIGNRKIAEEKLRASELAYRCIMEQATDGIFVSDESGRYTDVNESGCAMLGYTRAELLNMTVGEILMPGENKSNPPRLNELLGGAIILSTRRLRRKDGALLTAEISAKKLSTGKLLGIARDITIRKMIEERLEQNEKLFRALIEKNADMMALMLPDGTVTYASPSVSNVLGFTPAEWQSKSGFDFFHPQDVPHLMEQMQGVLDTSGKSFIWQLRVLCNDGGYRWCEGTATNMLHDPDVHSFVFNFRDITERKTSDEKIQRMNEELELKVVERTALLERNMQQLRDSEEKFQKAFEASAAAISITRISDATYREVNDAFAKLTGFSKEELIGNTSVGLGIVLDVKKRNEVLTQIRDKGFARHVEIQIRNKQGEILEVLSSIETVMLGGERYAINVIYDITERKRAERQLELVNKELEAFSYSVSHDLRAPLRLITGYANLFEEDFGGQISEDGKRILTIIQYNANKMNSLIDDLLEFSRLGKKDLDKTAIDTTKLVQSVLGVFNSLLKPENIVVQPLLPIFADYALLMQVWENLISNAIKYSAKVKQPRVEIGSYRNGGEIVFYVKDNGVGFDMKYVNKLFAVFERLHRSEEFEGTGVGLSIVKRIVTRHDGRVWAEGKINEGATFYFALPG